MGSDLRQSYWGPWHEPTAQDARADLGGEKKELGGGADSVVGEGEGFLNYAPTIVTV
jgi:hypothetical protein